ncbi:MAG TPA: methylmalonyl Co-A mutase-associated GTPase MeaB, partial [Gammaproteobacteria bacterium]|nr:methylmalonyl Co-A mutase-associated GTPase MeaB [Gammaproteobacteria bacterium]
MVNLSKPTDSLASAVCTGHRAAIGKALSLVEGDSVAASRFCQEITCYTGQATVIGLTGPAGCGKSTLINAAIAHLRRQGLQIAVAAVDPSSAITGGAILGDRLRMTDHAQDAGVFIRSLSSRGHHGGLTRHIHRMVDVFDAAGFDVVMVETVGTGQNEQEITQITDALIVVCTGGQGDDVQALKAGILEIADVLVVNKADLIPAKTTI